MWLCWDAGMATPIPDSSGSHTGYESDGCFCLFVVVRFCTSLFCFDWLVLVFFFESFVVFGLSCVVSCTDNCFHCMDLFLILLLMLYVFVCVSDFMFLCVVRLVFISLFHVMLYCLPFVCFGSLSFKLSDSRHAHLQFVYVMCLRFFCCVFLFCLNYTYLNA